jgi:hypothetical protein
MLAWTPTIAASGLIGNFYISFGAYQLSGSGGNALFEFNAAKNVQA